MVARCACAGGRVATRPTSRRSPSERRARILDDLLAAKGTVLRKQAARNAPSPADAEEALQDGCLEFLRYYDGEPGDHAIAWLMLAVKHRAWEAGRRVRTREAFYQVAVTDTAAEEAEPLLHVLSERPGPAEHAERGEEAAAFFAALGRLRPDQRTALLLLGLGYSYREICERQGWSNTKVNRCLSEGRAALRARARAEGA
jgi:RNA polymerase sigma factor (sigma-70 family)